MSTTASNLQEKDISYLVHPQWFLPEESEAPVMVRASGCEVVDSNGRTYLDAAAGLYTSFIGHSRPEMAEVAAEQMRTLEFITAYNGMTNDSAIRLAEKLVTLMQREAGWTHMRSAFFAAGGAEANEVALDAALWYWKNKGRPSKCRFLSLEHCYHGSTLLTSSASQHVVPHLTWDALVERITGSATAIKPLFLQAPLPHPTQFDRALLRAGESVSAACARMLEEMIVREGSDSFAAMIIEPILGNAGVIPLPAEYLVRVRELCTKYDILLIADEVLTGFGRTGKWFGLQHTPSVKPDMVTFAKAVSSGYLPLAGVVFSDLLVDAMRGVKKSEDRFMHGMTFSGHPTCCAVGLRNLELIERDNLVTRAAEMGLLLKDTLSDDFLRQPGVRDVRGVGLLVGIELDGNKAKAVRKTLMDDYGVLVAVNAKGDTINLAPPALITFEQIQHLADALKSAIRKNLSVVEKVGEALKTSVETVAEQTKSLFV